MDRFILGKHYLTITDTVTGKDYYIGTERIANELCTLLNTLDTEREEWKICSSSSLSSFSIFSNEVSVLQETRDIDRFIEMYYKYVKQCLDRYEGLKERED